MVHPSLSKSYKLVCLFRANILYIQRILSETTTEITHTRARARACEKVKIFKSRKKTATGELLVTALIKYLSYWLNRKLICVGHYSAPPPNVYFKDAARALKHTVTTYVYVLSFSSFNRSYWLS